MSATEDEHNQEKEQEIKKRERREEQKKNRKKKTTTDLLICNFLANTLLSRERRSSFHTSPKIGINPLNRST
jgi:hypothetical protein